MRNKTSTKGKQPLERTINEYKIYKNKEGALAIDCVRSIGGFKESNEDDFCAHLVDFMNKNYHLDKALTEEMYCLVIDDDLSPVGIMQIGHGSETQLVYSDRSAILLSTLLGAEKYVLIHNHPKVGGTIADSFSEEDVLNKTGSQIVATRCGMELELYVLIYDGGCDSMK